MAITHGKELSSCTLAAEQAGAVGLATRSQPARLAEDRERSDRTKRTVITERRCFTKGRTKLPSEGGGKEGKECDWKNDSLSLPPSLRL